MQTTLQKTQNYYRCIGTLYESNLKQEACDIKLKKDGKDNGTTKGQRIMGNISVKTDKGVHTFNVYFQSLTAAGEESKQWKMAQDMLDWNPRIGGNGDEPTLVNIEGSVSVNDYVGQDGKVKSGLRWRVSRGNTKAGPEQPKGATLKATLYIHNIAPETRMVNGEAEETGRLSVTLYGAENNGTCFPVNAIVEEEMAEDFEDCYEVGMTVPFEFELVTHHVGEAKNSGKKKFGRSGEVAVNSGFDVTELILVGGDDEIEEPDELTTEDEDGNEVPVKTRWINPKTMKLAIKERANMLAEMEKNPPEKKEKNSRQSNMKADKAKARAKVGKTTDFEESNYGFDEDPDDIF